MKWIDNRKPIFTFRTHICSTIFSQDSNLNEFFKQFSLGSNSKQLSMALRKIHVVETNSIAQYFPVILNMLIGVLCTRTDSCLREAFESFTVVLEKVQALPNYSSTQLIRFYIDYIFENPSASQKSVYPFQILTSQFAEMVTVGQSSKVFSFLFKLHLNHNEVNWNYKVGFIFFTNLFYILSRSTSKKTFFTCFTDQFHF